MTATVIRPAGGFGRLTVLASLSGLTLSPRRWFGEVFSRMTLFEASRLLLLAGLLHAIVGALPMSSGGLVRAAILMINALGMTLLHAAVTGLIVRLGGGPRIRLARIWMVFAVATAPPLLIGWVPYAFFFSEPWRWVLAGMGMIHGLGVNRQRTVVVLVLSVSLTTMLVLSVMHALA